MPASIGAVFFSKPVALPFMRWRMLRHGYLRSPVHYEEVMIDVLDDFGGAGTTTAKPHGSSSTKSSQPQRQVRGVWMVADPSKAPDVCVYYLHGGGMSMGSCYFYLEFLFAWMQLLRTHESGVLRNPAVLAVDYTLMPEETYPTQLEEVVAGYRWLLRKARREGDEGVEAVAERSMYMS